MSDAARWLRKNLLTLNSKKTKFICFHKTAASGPKHCVPIKIHSCDNSCCASCPCEVIDRIDVIKYLGILIDENLNFKAHITCLSKRIRKTIYIFKRLRYSADVKLLRTIYLALCQSIITYGISVWGSAAKTSILVAERAQRSVLRVMLRKPYRYPTNSLYAEALVLTVRQLFIYKVCITVHRNSLKMENYTNLITKRIFVLPKPRVNTNFGRRFGEVLGITLYNIAVRRQHTIKNSSVSETKKLIFKWLTSLSYSETETLLLKLV